MNRLWKNNSIRRKLLIILLSVSLPGLFFSMAVSIYNLSSIKNASIGHYKELVQKVSTKSESALINQMKENIGNMVDDRSTINVSGTLGEYWSYIQDFSNYINRLYTDTEQFAPQEVNPPDANNQGTYMLQLVTMPGIGMDSVQEEAALLGNVQYIFDPVIRHNQDIITSLFVATESGLLIFYDPNSGHAKTPTYDYKSQEWYQQVKNEQQPLFTKVYKSAYDWGVMTTCAAPFYKADGSFAGVVGIDLRLEDIHNQLIDVDVSENAVAYVLDEEGNIIAGPNVDYNSEGFQNIKELNPSKDFAKVAEDILLGDSSVAEVDEKFYAYAKMEWVEWFLVIEVPKEEVIRPLVKMQSVIQEDMEKAVVRIEKRITVTLFLLLSVIALCILLILGTSFRFTQRLVKPIWDMKNQVRVMSEGDLNAKVEVQTEDEIGELARGFNHMATSLKDYISEIKRVTADKERIGTELNVAAQIQSSMLPNVFPPYPERKEFDIYATMKPAKEVGGDFYDFFFVDENRLALVMADVSGKGVPAALFMVIAKTLIKDNSLVNSDPADIFTEVNRCLCESNDNGLFVTAWIGIIDIPTGQVQFTNAGHNPPLIAHKNGTFEYLRIRSGLVLAGMEDIRYKSSSLVLQPGDALFLYTDGVTEAMNPSMDLYGEDRLRNLLNKKAAKGSEELLDSVTTDLADFVEDADQFDDITMLAFHYYGEEISK